MDYKDLMVGDWIEDGYKKAQVTSITCDGIVETTAAISNIEVVDPIPLTEEILVKNGFKGNPLDGYYYWQDADRIELDGNFGYHGIVINYVHQLQHLLRLRGIEKEIEL
jgi:hypothetical protein